jgi:hypothetical protein
MSWSFIQGVDSYLVWFIVPELIHSWNKPTRMIHEKLRLGYMQYTDSVAAWTSVGRGDT